MKMELAIIQIIIRNRLEISALRNGYCLDAAQG